MLLLKPVAFVQALLIVLALAACTTDPPPPAPDEPSPTLSTDAIVSPRETVPTVTQIGERWKHALFGRNEQVVLLDIPTETESSDYVAKTWDEGANGFIEGWEQIRSAFLEETEQASEYHDSQLTTLLRTGFFVTLVNTDVGNPMGMVFDRLFYSVTSSTGEHYVLPSEWQVGENPALFFDAQRSALYISTDLGIWQIQADGTSKKLTSDVFDGKHYSWHDEAAYIPEEGWSGLFWVAHMSLCPDRRYIIYQSNRDCYGEGEAYTSVWRIDLETGGEQRILEGDAVNTIDGFVTDRLALIDGRFLLDISSGDVIPIALPDIPNRSIVCTGFGYIVCDSYKEEDAGLSSLYIFRIDPTTGAITETLSERGVFSAFGFSPSGKFAFVEYGVDPNKGSETLILFDFESTTALPLVDVLGEEQQRLGGDIVRANWLADNAILLQVRSTIGNEGVFHTWIAKW